MSALLEAKGLRASYGAARVLHGIDLELQRGSITALLGANGAGKTTILRALCQIMVRTEGSVTFDGAPIERKSTEQIVRLGVGHVPDGRGTFLELSTEENLLLGAYARRDRSGIADDMARIYDYFPRLRQRRTQQAGTLSGGEQQMLAVGRALMLRPRLLLLDEPSFGVAPLVVDDIFEILRRVNRATQMTILIVEQNAELALELAGFAYLVETGRVVLSGPSRDILRDDKVRQAYLGE
jgi:branched-chain amino acid transport system ATP-binding protein